MGPIPLPLRCDTKNMSRVAVCLSGQARAVEGNFACLKECILDPLDPDVFVYTWEAPEEKDSDYPQNPRKILELYDPRIYVEGNPSEKDFSPHDFDAIHNPEPNLLGWHFPRIKSMYYAIYHANLLRQQWGSLDSYDWVIRLRTDVILKGVLNLAQLEPSKLYLHIQQLESGPRYNDVFAISSPRIMDIYSDVYPNLGALMRQVGTMSATLLLTTHLKNHSVEVCESPLVHGEFYREGSISDQINEDLTKGKAPKIK